MYLFLCDAKGSIPNGSITLPKMRLLDGIRVVTCAATLAHLSNSSPPTYSITFPFKANSWHWSSAVMSTDNYAFWWNPCQSSHPSPWPTHHEKLPLPQNKCLNVHGLGMEGSCYQQEACWSPLVRGVGHSKAFIRFNTYGLTIVTIAPVTTTKVTSTPETHPLRLT